MHNQLTSKKLLVGVTLDQRTLSSPRDVYRVAQQHISYADSGTRAVYIIHAKRYGEEKKPLDTDGWTRWMARALGRVPSFWRETQS